MTLNGFMVTFGSLLLTTILLYLIGHMFQIPWLMFQHEYTNGPKEFHIYIGSLTPLIIGLIVSYFAEKIYMYRCK